MKKYLFSISILFAAITVTAQPGKKPAADKIPTQKEMQAMMKEAQKAVNELDPATKKMMDSMGIKMPSFNNVPNVSDKQLATVWENETRIVPKKDVARIASIAKKLTDADLKGYVEAVQRNVSVVLSNSVKTTGEKVFSYINTNSKNKGAAGNMAVGLWIDGKQELALFVLGKICAADPAYTDNLNNYASMLSMTGAPNLAIPILNNLNLKFPRNSTLLNNLGQAWFGLGDIPTAEKYLDSAIRLCAAHPQANMTKAAIEESKGNKAAAISAVKKSIAHTYTEEKETKLRQLGNKLSAADVYLPKNRKSDGLNLGGSAPPPFPHSVDECIALEPVWAKFREELKSNGEALKSKYEAAMQLTMQMHEKRAAAAMQYAKNIHKSAAGGPALVPVHARAAGLKLNEVQEEYDRKFAALGKRLSEFYTGSGASLKIAYDKEMERLHEEDTEQTGEGMPNKDFCPRYKETSDKYISAYNSQIEPLFREYLTIQKTYLNDRIQYQLYAEWPEKFEASKLLAQMAWLGALYNEVTPFVSITNIKCNKATKVSGGKLSNFEDIHCPYNDTLNLGVIQFYQNCSRMTSKLNLQFAEYTRMDDFNRAEGDTYTGSTIKISVEKGFDDTKGYIGPVKVEAKIGVSLEFEFDRGGVKDVIVSVEIGRAHV